MKSFKHYLQKANKESVIKESYGNVFDVNKTSDRKDIASFEKLSKRLGEVYNYQDIAFIKQFSDRFYIIVYDTVNGGYFEAWSNEPIPIKDGLSEYDVVRKMKIARRQ